MGKTLGVLSGVGHLPVDVVRGAKKAGYRTVAIALVPGTHEDLEKEADVFHAINIGKVGKIFKTLKQEGRSHHDRQGDQGNPLFRRHFGP